MLSEKDVAIACKNIKIQEQFLFAGANAKND